MTKQQKQTDRERAEAWARSPAGIKFALSVWPGWEIAAGYGFYPKTEKEKIEALAEGKKPKPVRRSRWSS